MGKKQYGFPLAVVLGLSPTGLYAVRELGKASIRVLGIMSDFECGFVSKYLTHPEQFWKEESHDILLERLIKLSRSEKEKPVLIPTSDNYIDFISRHYDTLKQRFVFQESYSPERVASLMDKGNFYEECKRYEIDTPLLWTAASKKEMADLDGTICYPCILKPKLIHEMRSLMKGQKVLIVRNREEYNDIIKKIPGDAGEWLIQEIIPGDESQIFLFSGYFDRNSNPLHTFTARKVRQYPPGFGSASLVISEANSEIKRISEKFLKQMGFQGICGAEFKFDSRDSRWKMIEINPRPTLWFNITNTYGKRFVETAYQDLTGSLITGSNGPSGEVLWKYSLKDIYSSLFYIRNKNRFILPPPEVGKYTGGSRLKRSWAVYDIRDILPVAVEPLIYLKKLMHRIIT